MMAARTDFERELERRAVRGPLAEADVSQLCAPFYWALQDGFETVDLNAAIAELREENTRRGGCPKAFDEAIALQLMLPIMGGFPIRARTP